MIAVHPQASRQLTERAPRLHGGWKDFHVRSYPLPYPPGGIEAPIVDHAIARDGVPTGTAVPHALNVTVLVVPPPDVAAVEAYASGVSEPDAIVRRAVDAGSSAAVTVPEIWVAVMPSTRTEAVEVGIIGTKML